MRLGRYRAACCRPTVVERTLQLRFAKAPDVLTQIELARGPGAAASLDMDLALNRLTVRGTARDVRRLEKHIRRLDRPVPQVIVDAVLIEMSAAEAGRLGLSEGVSGTAARDLHEKLSELERIGRARTLAAPRVLASQDQTARFQIGEGIVVDAGGAPIPSSEAGTTISLTPHVREDGAIELRLAIDVRSLEPRVAASAARMRLLLADDVEVVAGLVPHADRQILILLTPRRVKVEMLAGDVAPPVPMPFPPGPPMPPMPPVAVAGAPVPR
jgi:type II secretory pathway component HofQ